MITLKIENFRSIAEAEIEISPITVLYGPNGSGKSSILYSLLILRNVLLNSNQPIDGFFNLNFVNLGGFEQVIFDHLENGNIKFEMQHKNEDWDVVHGIGMGRESSIYIYAPDLMKDEISLPITFPYPANAHETIAIDVEDHHIDLIWNGITVQSPAEVSPDAVNFTNRVMQLLNRIPELLRRVDMIPLRRGFTKPSYSSVSITPFIFQEDEVATLLATDRYLEGKILSYCNDIFNKTFQVRPQLGTGLFYLQVTDEKGITTELVNEGFGLNQTIFMLTKLLRSDVSTVCIEEPEIHLHPSAQDKLVRAFIRSVREEGKTIILSTHSEHILSSLLSSVARGEIKNDEVSCYLCTRKRKQTEIVRQSINPKGQIEGGLSSFMESELENLINLLGVSDEG